MKAGSAVFAALFLAACSRPEPLPDLGSTPDFSLIDQTGGVFERALRGHVWVADFIYTQCPGPCPLMSERMRRIQTRTSGRPSIRLVSFSVDPSRDTPIALAAYAKRFTASRPAGPSLPEAPRRSSGSTATRFTWAI